MVTDKSPGDAGFVVAVKGVVITRVVGCYKKRRRASLGCLQKRTCLSGMKSPLDFVWRTNMCSHELRGRKYSDTTSPQISTGKMLHNSPSLRFFTMLNNVCEQCVIWSCTDYTWIPSSSKKWNVFYRSQLQKVHRSHQDSHVHRHRASVWERRRTTPGSWTAPEHMSLSLGTKYHTHDFEKPRPVKCTTKNNELKLL